MKKLILVSGKARSGKDSFCKHLTEDLDSFQWLDMTGGLKEVVAKMFKVRLSDLEDMKDDNEFCGTWAKDFTARHFLQFIGNEIAPDLVGKYHWCLERQSKMFSVDRDINILSGVRQLKEIEYFSKMNPDKEVIVVKLERKQNGKPYSPINESDKSHSTETEVDLITEKYCKEQGASYYEFSCENLDEVKSASETFKQLL